ncbi:hypothetical protein P2318_03475 [Myxococcaceae bacterium GXIMD 01537]
MSPPLGSATVPCRMAPERQPPSLDALLLAPALVLAGLTCGALALRHGTAAAAFAGTLFLVPAAFRLSTRPWYRGLVLRGLALFLVGVQVPVLLGLLFALNQWGCEGNTCGQTMQWGVRLAPAGGLLLTVGYWLVGRPPV